MSSVPKYICPRCGAVGNRPATICPGSSLVQILFFFLGLVPGIIYTMWRVAATYQGCGRCGSNILIHTKSPMGQRLLLEWYDYEADDSD